MSKHTFFFIVLTTVICGVSTTQTQAQTKEISTKEKKFLKEEASNLLEYYKNILELIGDLKTPSSERKVYIEEAYLHAFADENVYIEDDLIADRKQERYTRVKEYLRNINLFFYKSDVVFEFKNLSLSDIFVKDYLFILVNFDKTITGTPTDAKASITQNIKRQAEIRFEKTNDEKWTAKIVNIGKPLELSDFTKVAITKKEPTITLKKAEENYNLSERIVENQQNEFNEEEYEEYIKEVVAPQIKSMMDDNSKIESNRREIKKELDIVKKDLRGVREELKGVREESSAKDEVAQELREEVDTKNKVIDTNESIITRLNKQAIIYEDEAKQFKEKMEKLEKATNQFRRDITRLRKENDLRRKFINQKSSTSKKFDKFLEEEGVNTLIEKPNDN